MRGRSCAFWLLLCLSVPVAFSCKCTPERRPCQELSDSSVVFSGTVTNMGVTAASLVAELARVVSRETLEQLLRSDESDRLSFAERKAMWGRLLPKEAQSSLRKARTEEEVEQLLGEYFPTLTEGDQPVHFAVDETFKGKHQANRKCGLVRGWAIVGSVLNVAAGTLSMPTGTRRADAMKQASAVEHALSKKHRRRWNSYVPPARERHSRVCLALSQRILKSLGYCT